MADVSQIKLPDNTVLNIKDKTSGYMTGMTILSYGTSTYAEALAAYQANRVIYCRASSNSNPATGNQLRMAFLAYVNNQTTPTEFEFQYYRSVSSHTSTQQGDQVYVYKINSSGTWSVTTREVYTKILTGTGLTSSYTTGINASITLKPKLNSETALSSDLHYVGVDSNGNLCVSIAGGSSGTVTSVGLSNDTDGGLTVSGSPVTSSGTITVGHSNVLTSAQTTSAVYPIKIDKNGHISEYGSAVSIPTSASSGTTGISIADHSTTSIYGVKSTTTSVTGVSGSTSVYGVKSGTGSTTTASKASGSNGTASTWTFEEKSIPNVTAAGSGSFTQGSFSGGSLTMSINANDSSQLDIVFTAATHGTDAHTHTAPTLGTAIKVQSKSGGANGTADTWSFSDVTVPIRADNATTVPTAASSATTVPVINDSSTTVVTSKTHSVTDSGHTHSLS